MAIQVDANKDAQAPGTVLTSVIKHTNVPVTTIVNALADGSIDKMDNLQNYSLGSGACGITDLATISKFVKDQSLWDQIKAKVKAVSEKIANGSIKVVNAQIGEKFDSAGCPNVIIK
jgi:basic membrane protein A